ncbi:MAG TPA: hypothetical protein EYP74_01295 [Anaerolineales bacterium]|nr:hypothetical protein [Anaerolineales bacterium]
MHVFYEIILNRTLPTNPITEGADMGWGLALASEEKKVGIDFIMTVFYQCWGICQGKFKNLSGIASNAHLLGDGQMLKEKVPRPKRGRGT